MLRTTTVHGATLRGLIMRTRQASSLEVNRVPQMAAPFECPLLARHKRPNSLGGPCTARSR